MSDTRTEREHHFYVSIAKFRFHHPEHGIVSVRDPIKLKDAEGYGLTPLILYGLTVAGLPIRWLMFSPVAEPLAFRTVLLKAWNDAVGLRGRPDVLRVSRYLAKASPSLYAEMASIGVRLEIADGRDKSFPTSLRYAQEGAMWLLKRNRGTDSSIGEAVRALCRDAHSEHVYSTSSPPSRPDREELTDQITQWLALPLRKTPINSDGTLDWEAGRWLSAWESSLPPPGRRYFNHSSYDGNTWLLSWKGHDLDDEDIEAPYTPDNRPELAKTLLECWPVVPSLIARTLGVTLQELQWFSSGRANLNQTALLALEDLLGIAYQARIRCYVPAGPYVLIARKPQSLEEIYSKISDGGNAMPFELVPMTGSADPSWRYVLINTYSCPPSIVMIPRGDKIADEIPRLLLNYAGVRAVSPLLYRDVVSTCAQAAREPVANVRLMRDFAKRYEACWSNCMWHPD